mgnify:FL=1
MKKTVVLNHKTYLTLNEAKNYGIDINDYIRNDQEVIVCPSNIYIPYFTGKYNFKIGSQDISYLEITGETTGKMLKSNDIKYALVGHNERKNNLNETNKEINKKIKEAQKYNITPIAILGETYYENELKKTGEIITKTLKEYLKDTNENIIIGYEPNYTFEKSQIPTKEHIEEIANLIKQITTRKYNKNIKVLYGGNVSKNNIESLEQIKNLDGYLIGRESIKIKDIKQIFDKME